MQTFLSVQVICFSIKVCRPCRSRGSRVSNRFTKLYGTISWKRFNKFGITGIVCLKMKLLTLFTRSRVVPNFQWTTKSEFFKNILKVKVDEGFKNDRRNNKNECILTLPFPSSQKFFGVVRLHLAFYFKWYKNTSCRFVAMPNLWMNQSFESNLFNESVDPVYQPVWTIRSQIKLGCVSQKLLSSQVPTLPIKFNGTCDHQCFWETHPRSDSLNQFLLIWLLVNFSDVGLFCILRNTWNIVQKSYELF